MARFSQRASTRQFEKEEGKRNGLFHVRAAYNEWFVFSCSCELSTDTKASEKVSTIIQNKRFCADVKKLSPLYQTSACEAFHSVVIHYAPKSTAFSYNGMLSRYVMLFVGCYISSFHNSLKVVLGCLALQWECMAKSGSDKERWEAVHCTISEVQKGRTYCQEADGKLLTW